MKNYSLLELFHQDCMIRLFSKKSNLPFSVNYQFTFQCKLILFSHFLSKKNLTTLQKHF